MVVIYVVWIVIVEDGRVKYCVKVVVFYEVIFVGI